MIAVCCITRTTVLSRVLLNETVMHEADSPSLDTSVAYQQSNKNQVSVKGLDRWLGMTSPHQEDVD